MSQPDPSPLGHPLRRLAVGTLLLITAAIAIAQTDPAPTAPAAAPSPASPTAPAPTPVAHGGGQSLGHIFLEGIEWPAWFILLGSVTAIALIVEHFVTVRSVTIAPHNQIKRTKQLIETRNFRECMDNLRTSRTFFAQTMTNAMQHAKHGFDAMHEAALERSGELSGRMFRKVEYLNILGNLGPLLGLLGTVWGMIIAFGNLGSAGGAADPGGLARGISLALVNTLLGLALAILGLGFFGVCRNRVDALTTRATVDALDMLEYFRPTAAKRPAAEGAPPQAGA